MNIIERNERVFAMNAEKHGKKLQLMRDGYVLLDDMPEWTVGFNKETEDVIFSEYVEDTVKELQDFEKSGSGDLFVTVSTYYSKAFFEALLRSWGCISNGHVMDTACYKADSESLHVDTSYDHIRKVLKERYGA